MTYVKAFLHSPANPCAIPKTWFDWTCATGCGPPCQLPAANCANNGTRPHTSHLSLPGCLFASLTPCLVPESLKPS